MPWLEELSEPLQLRRCIRDLVALSSLAALWRDYNSEQIADSVAAALLPMLDADLVYVSVFGRGGDHSIEVFRTAETLPRGRLESAQKLLRSARDTWNGEISIGANPSGGEAIRVVAARIGADRESFIAAGSVNSKFPTETHRLLFDTAANDTNIALQQWQVDAQQRCLITLIERSSEFIGFSDLSGQPLYVNAAARELLGISTLQKFQNITIFDLMAEDERPRARTKLMALVLETG